MIGRTPGTVWAIAVVKTIRWSTLAALWVWGALGPHTPWILAVGVFAILATTVELGMLVQTGRGTWGDAAHSGAEFVFVVGAISYAAATPAAGAGSRLLFALAGLLYFGLTHELARRLSITRLGPGRDRAPESYRRIRRWADVFVPVYLLWLNIDVNFLDPAWAPVVLRVVLLLALVVNAVGLVHGLWQRR